MPQSLTRILLHVVFSTKNRGEYLDTPDIRQGMCAYLAGILNSMGCTAIIVNACADHVHCLCLLSKRLTVADMLETVKKQSSRWVKTKGTSYAKFYGQRGYGAFSVSESNLAAVQTYIETQEQHHRRISFQDELRELFRRHNVRYDERYVWD